MGVYNSGSGGERAIIDWVIGLDEGILRPTDGPLNDGISWVVVY